VAVPAGLVAAAWAVATRPPGTLVAACVAMAAAVGAAPLPAAALMVGAISVLVVTAPQAPRNAVSAEPAAPRTAARLRSARRESRSVVTSVGMDRGSALMLSSPISW